MGKMSMVTERWAGWKEKITAWWNSGSSVYEKVKKVIGIIVMVFYRLRKVILAIPVAYYALKLADYNSQHLPEQVGVNLQVDGAFANYISRASAVNYPLMLTGACLVLMLLSRKSLWPWAVSIFTLALPILLLVSNMYPV